MTTLSQPIQQRSRIFSRAAVAIGAIGVIALAVYVWALLGSHLTILNALGIASFLALVFIPGLVAERAVVATLRQLEGSMVQSIGDLIRLSLRRSFFLLLSEAVIAVPLFVIFAVYFQILLINIFANIVNCLDGPCSVPTATPSTENIIPQSILILVLALGLWGMNVLACALGAAAAIKWRRATSATLVSILVLVVVYAVYFASVIAFPSLPLAAFAVAAVLLPCLVIAVIWLSSRQATIK